MGKNNDHFLYRQTISSRLCYFTEQCLAFHAQPNERKFHVFKNTNMKIGRDYGGIINYNFTIQITTAVYIYIYGELYGKHTILCSWGRVRSVGIATGYGLDGPRIESRWGARFFAHDQTGPRAHPSACTVGT
jgi:hypothetical protein